jgi:hypothetical protein
MEGLVMKAYLGTVWKMKDSTMEDCLCVDVAQGTKVNQLVDRWDLELGKMKVEKVRGTLTYQPCNIDPRKPLVPGLRGRGSWERLTHGDVCELDDKQVSETLHVVSKRDSDARTTRLSRIVPEGALLRVSPCDRPGTEIGRLSYGDGQGPYYINVTDGEELLLLDNDGIEVLSMGPSDCTFCGAKGTALLGLCDSCAKLRHELIRAARTTSRRKSARPSAFGRERL